MLVNQRSQARTYVDAGTGPHRLHIATHVGVDAIAISYCPRYNPSTRGTFTTLRWK